MKILCEEKRQKDRTKKQIERISRRQDSGNRLVFSGMILNPETKKLEKYLCKYDVCISY